MSPSVDRRRSIGFLLLMAEDKCRHRNKREPECANDFRPAETFGGVHDHEIQGDFRNQGEGTGGGARLAAEEQVALSTKDAGQSLARHLAAIDDHDPTGALLRARFPGRTIRGTDAHLGCFPFHAQF